MGRLPRLAASARGIRFCKVFRRLIGALPRLFHPRHWNDQASDGGAGWIAYQNAERHGVFSRIDILPEKYTGLQVRRILFRTEGKVETTVSLVKHVAKSILLNEKNLGGALAQDSRLGERKIAQVDGAAHFEGPFRSIDRSQNMNRGRFQRARQRAVDSALPLARRGFIVHCDCFASSR